jgi:biotin carboxylase
VRLCLIASKPTDSVIHGFLPAAARLGLEVVLLTDQPEEHERAQARARLLTRPGCPRPRAGREAERQAEREAERAAARDAGQAGCDGPPARFLGCDVWDARELIGAIAELPAPHAIVSNSDHLQTQTALAAAYFGVPGKDWRSALRAKNKPLMRRRLAEAGTEQVAAARIRAGGDPPDGLRYPVVLKPAEGVASEDVVLVAGPEELAEQSARILARRPGETLLAEEYLPGELRTLETLGDGKRTWVLGGFRTTVSPPPYFIEERLTWAAPPPEAAREHVLGALGSLGATFGACHTEYVDGGQGAALIEVNDRLIGDHGDFVLSDLLGVDLFDLVLRVHLGETLPAEPPRPWAGTGHAVIDYVVADRSGTLTAVPVAGARPTPPDVLLSLRPLRAAGDHIVITHTNRDYLGVISAIGADATAVEAAVAAARSAESWPVAGPRW